jgi:hypothetical protein
MAPERTLSVTVTPANPIILANSPIGTVVATITAAWSDGNPFTGTLTFTTPYNNDNNLFALSGNNLILNASVSGDVGTAQQVTVQASQ